MNVSSVSGTSALLQTSAVSTTLDASDLTGVAGTESSGISAMADLMKQLQSLSESDPDKFKKVMASLSKQLESAADSAQGGEAGALKDMAQKFADAAESGDLSSLKPPERPHTGSVTHPHKAKTAYEANGQQPAVDLAQMIKDTLAQYTTTQATNGAS
jgi:hypothetical protein